MQVYGLQKVAQEFGEEQLYLLADAGCELMTSLDKSEFKSQQEFILDQIQQQQSMPDSKSKEDDVYKQKAVPKQNKKLPNEKFKATVKRKRRENSSTCQQTPAKDKNYSKTCAICHDGGTIWLCDGGCQRSFHLGCMRNNPIFNDRDLPSTENEKEDRRWECPDCRKNLAICSICGRKGKRGNDVFKCKIGSCVSCYHIDCLYKISSQYTMSWHNGYVGPHFTCPRHYCKACHCSGDAIRLFKCWSCVNSYHDKCIPSGSISHQLMEQHLTCPTCLKAKRESQTTTNRNGLVNNACVYESIVQRNGGTNDTLPQLEESQNSTIKGLLSEIETRPPMMLDWIEESPPAKRRKKLTSTIEQEQEQKQFNVKPRENMQSVNDLHKNTIEDLDILRHSRKGKRSRLNKSRANRKFKFGFSLDAFNEIAKPETFDELDENKERENVDVFNRILSFEKNLEESDKDKEQSGNFGNFNLFQPFGNLDAFKNNLKGDNLEPGEKQQQTENKNNLQQCDKNQIKQIENINNKKCENFEQIENINDIYENNQLEEKSMNLEQNGLNQIDLFNQNNNIQFQLRSQDDETCANDNYLENNGNYFKNNFGAKITENEPDKLNLNQNNFDLFYQKQLITGDCSASGSFSDKNNFNQNQINVTENNFDFLVNSQLENMTNLIKEDFLFKEELNNKFDFIQLLQQTKEYVLDQNNTENNFVNQPLQFDNYQFKNGQDQTNEFQDLFDIQINSQNDELKPFTTTSQIFELNQFRNNNKNKIRQQINFEENQQKNTFGVLSVKPESEIIKDIRGFTDQDQEFKQNINLVSSDINNNNNDNKQQFSLYVVRVGKNGIQQQAKMLQVSDRKKVYWMGKLPENSRNNPVSFVIPQCGQAQHTMLELQEIDGKHKWVVKYMVARGGRDAPTLNGQHLIAPIKDSITQHNTAYVIKDGDALQICDTVFHLHLVQDDVKYVSNYEVQEELVKYRQCMTVQEPVNLSGSKVDVVSSVEEVQELFEKMWQECGLGDNFTQMDYSKPYFQSYLQEISRKNLDSQTLKQQFQKLFGLLKVGATIEQQQSVDLTKEDLNIVDSLLELQREYRE